MAKIIFCAPTGFDTHSQSIAKSSKNHDLYWASASSRMISLAEGRWQIRDYLGRFGQAGSGELGHPHGVIRLGFRETGAGHERISYCFDLEHVSALGNSIEAHEQSFEKYEYLFGLPIFAPCIESVQVTEIDRASWAGVEGKKRCIS